jgi:hypothetical protein
MSVEGGIGNDEPFIGYSADHFGIGFEDYVGRYSPTIVLEDTTPHRVSEEDFKKNTDWYIPAQEWANEDARHVFTSNTCAEYFINPAERIPKIDKTTIADGSGRKGVVTVTVSHNGKTQDIQISVYVETRECSKDQL